MTNNGNLPWNAPAPAPASPGPWNAPAPKPKDRDTILLEWQAAKEALEVAKEKEMELRKEAVAITFADVDTKEGTNRIELGAGYEAKAVLKKNYNVDMEKIDDVIEAIEACGNEGPFYADRLYKWTCTISVGELRKLQPPEGEARDTRTDTERKIYDLVLKALTITDGAPTLTIEAPKGSKRR